MKITDIKEAGCNNILKWAISKNANIVEDAPLISLIDAELFYIITIKDVNFFEVFNLTHIYRDKLKICEEVVAKCPANNDLITYFPGEYKSTDSNKTVLHHQIAENSIQSFMNLVSQMSTDNDIIHPTATHLFIPMISRRFDIQIPISFADIIEIINPEEGMNIFNVNYPNTLMDLFNSNTSSEFSQVGIIDRLTLALIKSIGFVNYSKRLDDYIKHIKYSSLYTYHSKLTYKDSLYKVNLLGFGKRDNITRSEIRLNLFKLDKGIFDNTLRRLSRLNTPLELEFVVQLPIYYMQLLENSFSNEDLKISYKSSMSNIVSNGLGYDVFKAEASGEDDDSEVIENAMDAYSIRITESNTILLKSLSILLEEDDIDKNISFSLLPSIYKTNAVLTFKQEKINLFKSHHNSVISDMFDVINKISEGIMNDIRKNK